MKIGSVEIELWSIPGITGAGPAAVDTERMIEVPLGLWFIRQFMPSVTEVGAVTPYYLKALSQPITHKIVDPYDTFPGCIRESATELNYSDTNVLSISTIEHIGHGEYGQIHDDQVAVSVLRNMMRADHYMVTWAAHWHAALDYLAESRIKSVIKLHRSEYSKWTPVKNLNGSYYGKEGGGTGPYPFGNGIYVVTNCKELLA